MGHLQGGRILTLKPQQGDKLAEPFLLLGAQVGASMHAQPGMHDLMRQNAARQQPWQAIQHQNGCHLHTTISI